MSFESDFTTPAIVPVTTIRKGHFIRVHNEFVGVTGVDQLGDNHLTIRYLGTAGSDRITVSIKDTVFRVPQGVAQ